ncbi:hypothetical protein K525DRAFT_207790 [Schizophyllum commune Loenen D]|nr:hypothetical protein K525DRAFT_207790 [Schizophyllum commune Loenen D]
MSVVSTMATANSAPAFGQTLALTGSTLPSSTSEPTRPLTHRDTIDLAAAASLDALAARPRFAELAKSMRSLAGRIRLGVAVGKWDEETLSRADVPETVAQVHSAGEDSHRSPQEANADLATNDDMDMDVDDQSRASGSRHASSSGSDSEDEPLSSQRRTKGVRRSPSASSSEDRIPTPPPRRTASSPSPSEDGSDYDAARDPVHEFVCDVAGCGRTYKYQGAFWKHMARHEQETLLRDEAWGKISTAKRGRGGSATRGRGMARRGGGTSQRGSTVSRRGTATARRGHGWTKVGRHREDEDEESDAESGPSYDDGLVRPFVCDFPRCGRAYTQSGSLHKHKNQKHTGARARQPAREEDEEEEESEESDAPSEPVRVVPAKPVRSLVCSCGREFKKANGLAIHRKAFLHA